MVKRRDGHHGQDGCGPDGCPPELNGVEVRLRDKLARLTDTEFEAWIADRHSFSSSIRIALVILHVQQRRRVVRVEADQRARTKPAPLPTARVVRRRR